MSTHGFIRIVSWHLSAGWTSRGGLTKTLCGRWAEVNAPEASEPPPNERSCESCFRVQAMQADREP